MAATTNANRPYHTGGQLVIGGHSYTFGSGGHNGLPSIPYGSFPITPNDIGPWGQAHGAIGINHNAIWDPMLGRYRQGIELHSGSGECLSSGCVAVRNFAQLKSDIQRMLQETGQAFINVGPNGISITPQQSGASALTGTGALQLGSGPASGPFSGEISPQGFGGQIGSGTSPIDFGSSLPQLTPEQYGLSPTVGEAVFNVNPLQLQNAQAQGFGPNSGFPDYSGDTLSMVNGQSPMAFGQGLPAPPYNSPDFGVYQSPVQSAGGNFGFDANPNFGALPSSYGMDYPASSYSAGSSYSFDPSAYTGYSFSQPNVTPIGEPSYSGYTPGLGYNYDPGLQGPSGSGFGYEPSGGLNGYQPDPSQGGTDLYGSTLGGSGVDPNSEFSLGSDLNGGFNYSPSSYYTQGNPEAVADWNQATQQYGAGMFGYDAQGNVVPYGQDAQQPQQNGRPPIQDFGYGTPQPLSLRPDYVPTDVGSAGGGTWAYHGEPFTGNAGLGGSYGGVYHVPGTNFGYSPSAGISGTYFSGATYGPTQIGSIHGLNMGPTVSPPPEFR